MKIYRGLKDPSLKKSPRAVAIGIFDGVHRGHRLILQKALRAAKARNCRATVVTFDPHPAAVLSGKAPAILMSLEHRLKVFKEMGLDETIVIRFTKAFSHHTRETFLQKILIERLGMKVLSVGDGFRFGRGAQGDSAYLRKSAAQKKFTALLVHPLKQTSRVISSTRIRQTIEKGDLDEAEKMLGRPVSVYGTVIRGKGRGKSLGFPTANLNPHHETLPPSGVYAAFGEFAGRRLKGVIHIGARPTFGEKERTLEVHFLDFHGNLYGKEVELFFKARLRDIKPYPNKAALIKAIKADIRKARAFLTRF